VNAPCSGGRPCPDDQIINHTSYKCVDKPKLKPTLPCERADSSAITDLDKNLKTKDCDIHDANEHGMTPTSPASTCKDNTTCPYVNTTTSSAALQPINTSIPSLGGSGTGSTCVNNCTGTPPSVDCTKTPNDPSCTQTLTPSTTTPTTKTCPDGSVIDASTSCPPPPSNNPNPPSSSNGGSPSGGSGNNNGGGGSGSGGSGSSAPQPSTVS